MKKWLHENYIEVAALLIVAMGVVIIALTPPVIVQAAPVANAAPDTCEQIAVIGNITTWQCEDLDGEPYLQNSVGFLTR